MMSTATTMMSFSTSDHLHLTADKTYFSVEKPLVSRGFIFLSHLFDDLRPKLGLDRNTK
jgi:hypothetical protein